MLNRILAETTAAMDPPLVGRRRLKLMYVTQIGSAPPRLAFFTNIEHDIPAHYIRFLEGRFRTALGLESVGYAAAARISPHRPIVGRIAAQAQYRREAAAAWRYAKTSSRRWRVPAA